MSVEMKLFDHADGVFGHFCIGRRIGDTDFWEFYNSGAWCSAGQVFTSRASAEFKMRELSEPPDCAFASPEDPRWEGVQGEPGKERLVSQAEHDAARLVYLESLHKLRQESGITAAMLRDGRAAQMVRQFDSNQELTTAELTERFYEVKAERDKFLGALHASAPVGMKCSDCTMDKEPCPRCYAVWWKKRHPNTRQL